MDQGRFSKAGDAFRSAFGAEPEFIVRSPGRVNLLGEHTDYNDGFVFPAAIDFCVTLAVGRAMSRTELVSDAFEGRASFQANGVAPGEVTGWGAYAAGVAWALQDEGFQDLSELNVAVHSDLPAGSGLSSSAALEVAFLSAWDFVGTYGLTGMEKALLAQKAENRYVGVNCGLMDMVAVAMGEEGHALLFDTKKREVRPVAIPDGLAIVVLDTCTPRHLASSGYNERRAQCEAACRTLGVGTLREATLNDLTRLYGVELMRARHVVTENQRCLEFVSALEVADLPRLGELMAGSHTSLRDDYEVSSVELDAMVEAARVHPACIGVRMTGAGFGGCCVSLVHQGAESSFLASSLSAYKERTGRTGKGFVCHPASGTVVFRSLENEA